MVVKVVQMSHSQFPLVQMSLSDKCHIWTVFFWINASRTPGIRILVSFGLQSHSDNFHSDFSTLELPSDSDNCRSVSRDSDFEHSGFSW